MTKTCKNCEKPFKTFPKRNNQYCSQRCYGEDRRGANNQNWKGGKYPSTNGYIYVRASHDHPHKMANGYIFEHRYVMEQHLGRYLEPHELVHHLNGIKNDNRVENLVVISKAQHNREHFKFMRGQCTYSGCDKQSAITTLCRIHYFRNWSRKHKKLPPERYRLD